MELFGHELSIEQVIGLVECNASPDEDLVHRAALELIAALRESQRRAQAAVVLREGENPDGTTRCSCPTCGRLFQEEAFVESFCPDCGQRLTLSGPQEAKKGEAK